jgi:hypothetical protein
LPISFFAYAFPSDPNADCRMRAPSTIPPAASTTTFNFPKTPCVSGISSHRSHPCPICTLSLLFLGTQSSNTLALTLDPRHPFSLTHSTPQHQAVPSTPSQASSKRPHLNLFNALERAPNAPSNAPPMRLKRALQRTPNAPPTCPQTRPQHVVKRAPNMSSNILPTRPQASPKCVPNTLQTCPQTQPQARPNASPIRSQTRPQLALKCVPTLLQTCPKRVLKTQPKRALKFSPNAPQTRLHHVFKNAPNAPSHNSRR